MNLWKLDSKKIVLEITEEGILELNEISNSVISNLEKMGFSLALDDFGTGFSSLSRLKNMPISLIKIDQSFVKNITRSEEDFKIVESIASLANSLGKEVLAEGIEDEESFALVKKINIHKCQGYLFAKPMSYDDFVAWLQA
jgi:EAL domain-containing protein (putative c-di-GMP-specific phosphodiesterase class I)